MITLPTKVLPDYFMISDCDGSLYDTRRPNWHILPPIRKGYQLVLRDVKGNSLVLRAALRAKFAWPGGYTLYGITNDGAALCVECMRREYRSIAHSIRHKINDGWQVVEIGCAANSDGALDCEHCNKVLIDGRNEGESTC